MKGQRSIYQTLFNEPVSAAEVIAPERKGRSEVLKQRQNELIICRYYYYVKIQERPYEKALELLEGEVFLATRTLIDIINRHAAQLKVLHQSRPDIKYFRTKYPYLNWNFLYQ